jgi:enoyl-CoA hydratase/carnithine racemase
MFALAHDYRVMRADRGFMCMNEVDIGLSLTRGMAGILNYKVPTLAVRKRMVLEGHRFPPQECLATGLVDSMQEGEEAVLAGALEMAGRLGRFARIGKTYGALKRELAAGYYDLFLEHEPISSPGFEKYSGLGTPTAKL